MAEFKLYGYIHSPPSRVAISFLRANGILFDYHEIDITKLEQKRPEYLAINPAGAVPALSHGDFSLGESAAIIQYVSEVKGLANNWWPADLKERASMYSYIHWHHTGALTQIGRHVLRSVISPRIFGRNFSEQQINQAKADCDAIMSTFNNYLEGGKCIAGTSEPSAADIVCLTVVQQVVVMNDYDLTPYPHLQQWYSRMIETEGIREVHEEFSEATRALLS